VNRDNYREFSIRNETSKFPDDTVVAMAYIPYQNPKIIYNVEQGLNKGTLFPCLDKPFLGCKGGKMCNE